MPIATSPNGTQSGGLWSAPVNGGSSLSVEQIRTALGNSPLAAYAERIYQDAISYGVDPALFLAIAKFESNFGRAASSIYDPATGGGSYNWASISNALYGGVPVPGSRWGQYPTPEAGIDAFFQLITKEYYPLGQTTIGSIMFGLGGSATTTGEHAYAPAFENSVAYFDNFINYLGGLIGGVVGGKAGTTPIADPSKMPGDGTPSPTPAPTPDTLHVQTPWGTISLPNPLSPVADAVGGIGSGVATAINTAEHDFWILVGAIIILAGLWLLVQGEK